MPLSSSKPASLGGEARPYPWFAEPRHLDFQLSACRENPQCHSEHTVNHHCTESDGENLGGSLSMIPRRERTEGNKYQRDNDKPVIDAIASDLAFGVESQGHEDDVNSGQHSSHSNHACWCWFREHGGGRKDQFSESKNKIKKTPSNFPSDCDERHF